MQNRTIVLDKTKVEQKITRIAYEILENNHRFEELILIGIKGNGYRFAEKIQNSLGNISDFKLVLLEMEIDKKNPENLKYAIQPLLNLTNKNVFLIDDVLESGRTLVYGVKHLLDFNVNILKTIILVNRRHRKYPIRADYVGLTLATTIQEHISVELREEQEVVYLS